MLVDLSAARDIRDSIGRIEARAEQAASRTEWLLCQCALRLKQRKRAEIYRNTTVFMFANVEEE